MLYLSKQGRPKSNKVSVDKKIVYLLPLGDIGDFIHGAGCHGCCSTRVQCAKSPAPARARPNRTHAPSLDNIN